MTEGQEGSGHYLLGHDTRELRRLDLQGELYREVTLRALAEAGVKQGMRVLDMGCGSGDVSCLAAEVVGPEGEVLGIDRGEAAVEAATARATARGLTNASFRVAEIDRAAGIHRRAGGTFDALVGRFVLMHQSEAAATLSSAVHALKPGGIVVMIESWMDLIRARHSEPHSPLYDEIVRFKCAVVEAAGADTRAGGRLRETFVAAGLPAPICRLDARLEGGPASAYYQYVEESVRSMLPEARRTGIAGFDSSGEVDGLAERLRLETTRAGGVLVVWPVVCAFSRVPR
ncbi:MAG: class I SAM-dependent methyltransferase [Gemmatimonadetes bacterium]|nr:class I SAM-dependent methyltransferase [Gemmatimonadota bacterium]